MQKKSNISLQYILDDRNKKVGVILPIGTYQKIKKFIQLIEEDKDKKLKLPKGISWQEAGFDKIRKKFKKIPNLNLDKVVREDRDRF